MRNQNNQIILPDIQQPTLFINPISNTHSFVFIPKQTFIIKSIHHQPAPSYLWSLLFFSIPNCCLYSFIRYRSILLNFLLSSSFSWSLVRFTSQAKVLVISVATITFISNFQFLSLCRSLIASTVPSFSYFFSFLLKASTSQALKLWLIQIILYKL